MEVQGIELGSRAGRAAVIDAVGMRTVRIIIAGRCRVVGQSRRRGTGSRLAFWRGCDRGGCDEGEWYVGRRWEGGGGGGGYHQFGVGPRGMKESGVTKPLSGADSGVRGKAGREATIRWGGGGALPADDGARGEHFQRAKNDGGWQLISPPSQIHVGTGRRARPRARHTVESVLGGGEPNCMATAGTLRARGAASLALLACAQAFAPTMLVVRRPGYQATCPLMSTEVPHRWQKVHECERPTKWRESMSDEDCEVYELELAAGRTESAGRDIVLERRRRFLALGRPGWRRKYSQVVPQLSTMEEFLAANRRAAGRDRLLVIVAYSHRCKACKRIASKFRRLASVVDTLSSWQRQS